MAPFSRLFVVAGILAVVGMVSAACAATPDLGLDPIEARPELLDDSIVDFFDGEVGPYTESEHLLVDLLVTPAAVPNRHRLVALEVTDPNGDGRVGGSWSTPRVVRSACSVHLDRPPVPLIAGVYIAGDPFVPPGDPGESLGVVLSAPSTLNVSVAVLDTEQQRDELLLAVLDSTRGIGDIGCDAEALSGEGAGSIDDEAGAVVEALLPGVEEFTPYDTGFPGWGIEVTGELLPARHVVYAVGERAIVQLVDSGARADSSLTPIDFAEVAVHQVNRVVDRGFG